MSYLRPLKCTECGKKIYRVARSGTTQRCTECDNKFKEKAVIIIKKNIKRRKQEALKDD